MSTAPARSESHTAPRHTMGWLALGFVLLSLCALVAVPLVVQWRVDALRAEADEAADPARTLVTRLQFSLSREMSSLRGFLLTGEKSFLDTYVGAVTAERRIHAELEPLAVRLGPDVLKWFVETRTLSEQWHTRADDDVIAQRRQASPPSRAEILTEQELFEETLRVSSSLDSVIVLAVRRRRQEIREAERLGIALTGLLGVLALGSAAAVGWLHRRSHQLAAEAERRRVQAEWALAESARAEEARARLLRGVTHDLKNPLGAANGYAELLEMGIKGTLAPEQAKLVAGIRRSVDGALAIITDLLDLARVDSGGLSVGRVRADLTSVTTEALEDHRAAAEAAGLALEWESAPEPLHVHTDPVRVKQVLDNLLSNAVKYTPAPGAVRVRIEEVGSPEAPRPGNWVAVRVRDTGPGIPPEQRETIFDEFTRLHDGTDIKGHGLGLVISRRIARLLGGDLSVESRIGAGAVFTLWLPLRSDGAEVPDSSAAAAQGQPPE